ncbi:MAG: DUF3857 domain-containing protein [Alphaproteobacteria bacterium]|nr:DUF3857 domain-containing protein [Alphaproteobacteria bacterium]
MQKYGRVARMVGPGFLLACVCLVLTGCQTDGNDVAKAILFGPAAVRQPAAPPAAATVGRYDTATSELAGRLLDANGLAGSKYAALELFEQMANAGNVTAQMSLVNLYSGMAGVRRDAVASATWAKKAAQAGSPDGQAAYGYYLNAGLGVEQNTAEAVKWLRAAADSRFSPAMRIMGDAYLEGTGVPLDREAAYAWFSLAESNAKTEDARIRAVRGRQGATLLMLPSEVDAGQMLANQWRPGRDVVAGQRTPAQARANAEYRVADNSNAGPIREGDLLSPEDIPSEITKLHWDYEVAADGSYSMVIEGQYLARNAATAHEMAQLPFSYHNTMETFEVVEAYTLKGDGRRMPVAPSAIMTQAGARSNQGPYFADESQKVIIYPSVETGDSVYFRVRYTQKPYFQGQFSHGRFFERDSLMRDVRIRISLPESMAVRTETHELKSSRRVQNGRAVYEWTWQNLKPERKQEAALDGFDRAPRFFVSTFKAYPDIGRSYAEMGRENTAVTPAVTALAEEITAGITDRRKQAEAIYDWVRQRIRYVQIRLGVTGSFVPHSIDSIITNRYGDCKDHATLFSALLAAKGIVSETVLINSGNSYALAGPPTFSSLNHVISWLPDFNVYVDTTAGIAPFGVLPFDQYGKPVVHASVSNPRMARTPALEGEVATITTRVNIKLGADGRLVGDADSSGTGPYAVWMRQRAAHIQSMGAEQAAKETLRAYGFEGSGRYQVEDIYQSAASYRVTGRFQTMPRRDLLSGNSFRPQGLLSVGSSPGDLLLGPIDLVDPQGVYPTPCFSGRQVQEIAIELPPGKRLRELPKGAELKNKHASYRSNWSQSGRTVTMRREFVSYVTTPVCVGETRRVVGKMLDDIRVDYYAALSLADE